MKVFHCNEHLGKESLKKTSSLLRDADSLLSTADRVMWKCAEGIHKDVSQTSRRMALTKSFHLWTLERIKCKNVRSHVSLKTAAAEDDEIEDKAAVSGFV